MARTPPQGLNLIRAVRRWGRCLMGCCCLGYEAVPRQGPPWGQSLAGSWDGLAATRQAELYTVPAHGEPRVFLREAPSSQG